MAFCSLVVYRRFGAFYYPKPPDGDREILYNVATILPDFMASHLKRLCSQTSLLSMPADHDQVQGQLTLILALILCAYGKQYDVIAEEIQMRHLFNPITVCGKY